MFTAVPKAQGISGTERWLSDWKKTLKNPREGSLTVEDDRPIIDKLTSLAEQHYGKSWVYPYREMRKVLRGVNVTPTLAFGTSEVALEDHSDSHESKASDTPLAPA